ncbi:MAG: GGDEF domain-containing protein [Alcanivoracaceae bacterium]|nr:GGDEF domain-containing protein [Alcanivoracaceae bacterium]
MRGNIFKSIRWNRVERGCAPVTQILVIGGVYLWGLLHLLARDDRALFINVEVAETQTLVVIALMLGAAALLGLGLILRVHRPNSILYQYTGALFFALSMVWAGYITGAHSFAAGVVLIGSGLSGYVALERRVIALGVGVSFVIILGLNLGAAYGKIPYSPLLLEPHDTTSRVFWTNVSLFLALPPLIMNLALMGIMLHFWRKAENEILKLSLTDVLTGLPNRRSILSQIKKEAARTKRHGPPLAIVIIDLDGFKKINDHWGHPTGDKVLQRAAQCLRNNIRECDVVGRFGGEEFLLLLPDTNSSGAMALMERCRQALEQISLYGDDNERIPVHGSFGIVCNEENLSIDTDTLISAADQALYHAKETGKNRIVLANLEEYKIPLEEKKRELGEDKATFSLAHLIDDLIHEGPTWTPVAKSMLSMLLGASQFLLYASWGLLLLIPDNRQELINVEYVLAIIPYVLPVILGLLVLVGIGWRVNLHNPNSAWYQFVTQQYYGVALVFSGYLIGTMSLPVGLILAGGPLIGFIFFRARYIIATMITSMATLITLTYLSAQGVIPYAPVMPVGQNSYHTITPLWLLAFYLFLTPHMFIVLALGDKTFGHWRERWLEIRVLGRTDPLTRIHNRRSILSLLDKEIARTLRHGPPLAIALLDMDYFKKINDTWGHPTGDRVLKRAAKILQETIRECDAVGRFGGEEFMLLLPDTSLEGARILTERCREALSASTVMTENGEKISITASFGLTSNEGNLNLNSTELVKAADDALYTAKDEGRNRVSIAAPEAMSMRA